jgi:ferric-dicitrate binding protein FerR (iron transport regulator)
MADEPDGSPGEQRLDPVARLVRLAGTRTSVPPARAERVRASAHAEWTRVSRARARHRRFATAAAVLALAAMALLTVRLSTGRGARPQAPAATVATLVAVTGTVIVENLAVAGGRGDLPVGATIAAGRTLRTAPGTFAALELEGGRLRLDQDSRLRIDSERDVFLLQGAVYVDTGNVGGQDASLQVRTALGVIRDVGTRFEVRMAGDRLRVRIRDGEVIVSAGGASARAGRGMEVSTGVEGLLTKAVPTFGADWAWVGRTAPRFELAGRSLSEFLDWVSREGGYTIALDEGTRATAGTVILQGSIEGLTPDEALDVVLPSTGLEHRVIDGRVIIRSR